MRLRLRLSLLARMVVSVAILLSITLVLAVLLAGVGGFVGLALLGWLHRGAEVVAALPRISPLAPVDPLPMAVGAALTVWGVVRAWPHVKARTREEYLLPPTSPISAVATAVLIGCLYLAVVEAAAASLAGLSTLAGVGVVLATGVVAAYWVTVTAVRGRIRELRDEVVAESTPIGDATPGVEAVTRRLAQQADIPAPEVRLAETDRPESVTVGAGEDAVVVVSTGLLSTLTEAERDAVLAHEVSHLANGDSRVLGAALAPVLAADEFIEADPDRPGDYVWNWVFAGLKLYAQFGVAVLSRGREWCADAGAAELTGSPAALASALRKLDAERGAPETDLREWERAVAVADILPPADPDVATGPFRTHPATADRVEHLEGLTRTAESGAD